MLRFLNARDQVYSYSRCGPALDRSGPPGAPWVHFRSTSGPVHLAWARPRKRSGPEVDRSGPEVDRKGPKWTKDYLRARERKKGKANTKLDGMHHNVLATPTADPCCDESGTARKKKSARSEAAFRSRHKYMFVLMAPAGAGGRRAPSSYILHLQAPPPGTPHTPTAPVPQTKWTGRSGPEVDRDRSSAIHCWTRASAIHCDPLRP